MCDWRYNLYLPNTIFRIIQNDESFVVFRNGRQRPFLQLLTVWNVLHPTIVRYDECRKRNRVQFHKVAHSTLMNVFYKYLLITAIT